MLTGSHLESQNHAGWLDGALGVIYGLEAARAIAEDPDYADCGVDVIALSTRKGISARFSAPILPRRLDEEEIDPAKTATTITPS